MKSQRKKQTHIVVIEEPLPDGACDRVGADLHGNAMLMKRILHARKNKHDRTFLAGDLVDRGRASIADDLTREQGNVRVIYSIVDNNEKAGPGTLGKVFAVRGNHEQFCLNTINHLLWLTNVNLYGFSNKDLMMIIYVLSEEAEENKGLRMVFSNQLLMFFLQSSIFRGKKFFDEFFNTDSTRDLPFEDKVAYIQKNTRDYLREENIFKIHKQLIKIFNDILLHVENGGQWLIDLYQHEYTGGVISANEDFTIEFDEKSAFVKVKEYLESLPIVIIVKAKVPFAVVHGDLPLSIEELLALAEKGAGLTDDEINYALNARPGNSDVTIKRIPGCNSKSMLNITGHTIDGGVRANTNTLNVDVAGFVRDAVILVVLPDCVPLVVGERAARNAVKNDRGFKRVYNETLLQLQKQPQLMAAPDHSPNAKLKKTNSAQGLFRKKTARHKRTASAPAQFNAKKR